MAKRKTTYVGSARSTISINKRMTMSRRVTHKYNRNLNSKFRHYFISKGSFKRYRGTSMGSGTIYGASRSGSQMGGSRRSTRRTGSLFNKTRGSLDGTSRD